MAQVASERLDEMQNPELAINRGTSIIADWGIRRLGLMNAWKGRISRKHPEYPCWSCGDRIIPKDWSTRFHRTKKRCQAWGKGCCRRSQGVRKTTWSKRHHSPECQSFIRLRSTRRDRRTIALFSQSWRWRPIAVFWVEDFSTKNRHMKTLVTAHSHSQQQLCMA